MVEVCGDTRSCLCPLLLGARIGVELEGRAAARLRLIDQGILCLVRRNRGIGVLCGVEQALLLQLGFTRLRSHVGNTERKSDPLTLCCSCRCWACNWALAIEGWIGNRLGESWERSRRKRAAGWWCWASGNLLFGWLAFLGKRRQLCFSDTAAILGWMALPSLLAEVIPGTGGKNKGKAEGMTMFRVLVGDRRASGPTQTQSGSLDEVLTSSCRP